MSQVTETRFTPSLVEMREVRNFLGAALQRLDPDIASDVILATSELIVNERSHGANSSELRMELRESENGVDITLRNVTITKMIYQSGLTQLQERKRETGAYYRSRIGEGCETDMPVSAGLGLYLVDQIFTSISWFEGGVTLVKTLR